MDIATVKYILGTVPKRELVYTKCFALENVVDKADYLRELLYHRNSDTVP